MKDLDKFISIIKRIKRILHDATMLDLDSMEGQLEMYKLVDESMELEAELIDMYKED